MEYYSSIKGMEYFVTTWMSLESIMLHEISQMQKATYDAMSMK